MCLQSDTTSPTWLSHSCPSAVLLPVDKPALALITTHEHAEDLCKLPIVIRAHMHLLTSPSRTPCYAEFQAGHPVEYLQDRSAIKY